MQSVVAPKTRPADLPDFDRPPLVEVVMGVQFAELRGYRTQHAGLLWERKFRTKFGTCVERPPLDPVFETFGAVAQGQARLKVSEMPGPQVPRLWFINHDETELIQIQSDRFLHNWRRNRAEAQYPRYETIRDRFFEELTEVQSFFEGEKIGSIEPNQCEVRYVNHISLEDGADPHTRLDRVFAFLKSLDDLLSGAGTSRPRMEDGRVNVRFAFVAPGTENLVGRLHVEIQPAIDNSGDPILRLDLAARGVPSAPTFQGVADFMDIGREAIVRGFAAITTVEMHDYWGRKQ